MLLSTVAVSCYSHTCNHTGSNFYISLPTFIAFFDSSYLMDVKGYLIVVLICIYITISDVAHLFMCLLAIWISFLKNCLFKSFAHFWIGWFVFCCLVLEVPYRLLILIPYQIYDLQYFLLSWVAFSLWKCFFWRGYQIASFERMVQKNLSRCLGTTYRKGKVYPPKKHFQSVVKSILCKCGYPVLCITLLIQVMSLNEVNKILSVAGSCSSSSNWLTLPKCNTHSTVSSSFSRSLGSGSLVSWKKIWSPHWLCNFISFSTCFLSSRDWWRNYLAKFCQATRLQPK